MNHLTHEDAARWAAGLLDEGRATSLEAHARSCSGCEALLAEEARAEVLLAAALEALPAPGPHLPGFAPLRRSPRLTLVLVPLALAASLAVFFAARASAELDGPGGAAPRYEHEHQVPLESLAALAPVGL